LPFGGELDEAVIQGLAERVGQAITRAKNIGQVTMEEEARQHWAAVYGVLSAEQSGLLGAVTARAEAQVVRLALVYALLDCAAEGAAEISGEHLKAALAVWGYCETSAARIFGDALGDPVADEIRVALRNAGAVGMTRTAIRDLFGRNRSSDRIATALGLLMTKGLARRKMKETGGRPVETWFATKRGTT
jgi:hypothetical protein